MLLLDSSCSFNAFMSLSVLCICSRSLLADSIWLSFSLIESFVCSVARTLTLYPAVIAMIKDSDMPITAYRKDLRIFKLSHSVILYVSIFRIIAMYQAVRCFLTVAILPTKPIPTPSIIDSGISVFIIVLAGRKFISELSTENLPEIYATTLS